MDVADFYGQTYFIIMHNRWICVLIRNAPLDTVQQFTLILT